MRFCTKRIAPFSFLDNNVGAIAEHSLYSTQWFWKIRHEAEIVMEGQRMLLEQVAARYRNCMMRRNAANDHASIVAIEIRHRNVRRNYI